MIERKFIQEKIKEYMIEQFVSNSLKGVGLSKTKLVKTPLGEKIVVYTSRPGLVVGRKGQNIKQLTKILKKKFNLENPQLEISEVENPNMDATIVAQRISENLEMYGTQKFKAIGHKFMQDVMNSGALGIEIRLSGKIPSARAKSWRFYSGYLKKSGDMALTNVDKAYAYAQLKTGTIGVRVSIMLKNINLPTRIGLNEKAKEEPAEKKTEGTSGEDKDKTGKKIAEKQEEPKKDDKPKKRAPRKKKKEAKPEVENAQK